MKRSSENRRPMALRNRLNPVPADCFFGTTLRVAGIGCDENAIVRGTRWLKFWMAFIRRNMLLSTKLAVNFLHEGTNATIVMFLQM